MRILKRGFASDNNATVHPAIMKAIQRANSGHTVAYGDDPYTQSALGLFKKHFGDNSETFFVFNGTAANVLGISAITRPHNAVICTESSHINVDECGAPEKFSGCKLIPVKTGDGKLTVELIRPKLEGIGFEHHVQPKVISITQATEIGTVYSVDELRRLADFAHRNGMLLHVDGARIANAAANLGVGLKEITADAGVDVLSFGGTKNGMMYGEAIVFFNPGLAKDFKYTRKQGMQLASKMRFISAQFEALLSNDLWLKNARHANRMAQMLSSQLEGISGLEIIHPVKANGIFVKIPKAAIKQIQREYFFYVWDEASSIVRWMTSFDTTISDVKSFVSYVRSVLAR